MFKSHVDRNQHDCIIRRSRSPRQAQGEADHRGRRADRNAWALGREGAPRSPNRQAARSAQSTPSFPDLDALILAVSARTLAHLDAPSGAGPRSTDRAGRGRCGRPRGVAWSDLALAYLDFAHARRASWRALFGHRLPEGRSVPEWLVADQSRLFGKVEGAQFFRPS